MTRLGRGYVVGTCSKRAFVEAGRADIAARVVRRRRRGAPPSDRGRPHPTTATHSTRGRRLLRLAEPGRKWSEAQSAQAVAYPR